MKINNTYNNTSMYNVSFKAVHPVRYLIKCPDGKYYQAISEDIIKQLQKQLIGRLNKYSKRSTLAPSNKHLKEINYVGNIFKANDPDFIDNPISRSVYLKNRYGETIPYILTGNTTHYADTEGKNIGRFNRNINESAMEYCENNNANFAQVKKAFKDRAIDRLSQVTQEYYEKMRIIISNLLSHNNSKDTNIDIFYNMTVTKGKYDYNLMGLKFHTK